LILLPLAGFFTRAAAAPEPCPNRLHPESLRKHAGFEWKSARSASFDYFFEPSSPAERDIDTIKKQAEEYRARVERLLGGKPAPFQVDIFIVDSYSRMKALCGYEFSWACGTTLGILYGNSINSLGTHEDCHIMASRLWGPNREKWLQEGLAVYSDDRWEGLPLHALCKHLHDAHRLIPIQSLIANGWHTRYSSRITYPELGSFVKFLYEKYGINAVKPTWEQGARRIPQIFGKRLSQLEEEWLSTIRESDAGSITYQPD
jgi:hypothetical protein